MMPEVSGFDVIGILKGDPATRGVPIIVVTAKELSDIERAGLTGQVVGILNKGSLAAVDLLAWLDELLPLVRAGGEATHVG
jgi:CheY-like chemotaxis protein